MIEWDENALATLAAQVVREVTVRALPVMQKRTSGKFNVWLDGTEVVSGEDGLVAEYGTTQPGDPWVFPALNDVSEVMNGHH